MRMYRFGGLAIVAALAACTGDSPTGIDAPEVVDGVNINRVADLGQFRTEQYLVVDDELQCETLDFSEFAGGSIHDPLLLSALGVNIEADVLGWTDVGTTCGTGDLVIFDTNVPSVWDPDLVTAGQLLGLGNVLAHQSCNSDGVGEPFAPNDAAVEDTIRFTFPEGEWFVGGYTALDQEGPLGEFIALNIDVIVDGGTQVAITDITMNNADAVEIVDIAPEAMFTRTLDFHFDGSGAIDDIEICKIVERGGEGCTPGYWKQSQHFGNWPVSVATLFSEAFPDACDSGGQNARSPESGDICGMTLLEALGLRGGGQNALARHAAAAWLNAGSTVEFKYLQSEVESMVEAAFDSDSFESTKNALSEANEAGCPLGRAELDD